MQITDEVTLVQAVVQKLGGARVEDTSRLNTKEHDRKYNAEMHEGTRVDREKHEVARRKSFNAAQFESIG